MARSGGNILRKPASPTTTGPKKGLIQFFGEVVSELKQVTWPSREETVRLTLLVIAVSAATGFALGLVDIIFTRLLDLVIA
ncbi:MAG: preprotein translocase subunit SecE [Chloroflexi bacterium]|nr:MAG: preprotein translocase subunit SecE [Chloroflexota bacterium]